MSNVQRRVDFDSILLSNAEESKQSIRMKKSLSCQQYDTREILRGLTKQIDYLKSKSEMDKRHMAMVVHDMRNPTVSTKLAVQLSLSELRRVE